MPTPLLLGTTEAFEPPKVWWFVNDVTKLGILHAHARQTWRLQEPPSATRITNTTMYLLPPPILLAHCMPPTTPPINIINALPIDHISIAIILWNILTHKMPSIPIPHGDQHFSSPITPTTNTKLKDRTTQANITIIITWFKIMPYWTASALHRAV